MNEKRIVFYLGEFSDNPALFSKSIARNMIVAKRLLAKYEVEQVISVIDHVIARGTRPYSLIYIERAMESVLQELDDLRVAEQVKREIEHMEKTQERGMMELGKTEQRTDSYGIKRRLREKYSFDMLEE